MGDFWKEETYQPKGVGYGLFSTEYFIAFLVMMVIAAGAVFLFGRRNDEQKEKRCRILACVPLGMELLKFIVLASQGTYTPRYYPVGFCSLVAYLYPIYAFAKSDEVKGAARCVICAGMFPAGFLTLVFPGWIGKYPFLSYFSLHSYIWHAIMLVYPLWTWQKDREKLSYRDLLRGGVVIILMIPLVVLVNRKAGLNYWFLSTPSDNHPLAAIYHTAGAGGYFTVFVLMGCAISGLFAFLQNLILPRLLHLEKDNT